MIAAEPRPDEGCWIELMEPLAMPASSGVVLPGATVKMVAEARCRRRW